jgi:DNA-binding beta-propeller fold protein YncE
VRSGSPRRTVGLTAAAGLAVGVLALVFGPASEGALREPVASPGTPTAGLLSEPAHRLWSGAQSLSDPRCVRADPERDRVFVIGTDGGFHVFHCDGRHILSRPLPLQRYGNPQGIAVDADGNVLVADTHASRVLRLTPAGELLATYGRLGDGAGEINWVTGVCEAPDRTLWVTEYGMEWDGDHDRLHHLQADGSPIAVFGGTGKPPGKFYRPSNVAIGPRGNVWVADACNNRPAACCGSSMAPARVAARCASPTT